MPLPLYTPGVLPDAFVVAPPNPDPNPMPLPSPSPLPERTMRGALRQRSAQCTRRDRMSLTRLPSSCTAASCVRVQAPILLATS